MNNKYIKEKVIAWCILFGVILIIWAYAFVVLSAY